MLARESVTVGDAVHRAAANLGAAGIEDARIEAEVLLAHALAAPGSRFGRAQVLASLLERVPERTQRRFERLLGRRQSREPLAYIVAHREFYGLEIGCRAGALIPRPETELLVDIAIGEARSRGGELRVADVGTGSGCISIAIARNAPRTAVTAIERSPEALALARANVSAHGLETRVRVVEGDLLQGTEMFDVIVGNLPYVAGSAWDALQPEIREHEPRGAIVGGERGTELIERLLGQSPAYLAAGGVLALEIDSSQGDAMIEFASGIFAEAQISVVKDLAGLDRVLVVHNPRRIE
jgi:release factor glutamine methyltransferase